MSRLTKFLTASKRGCDMFEKYRDHCGECTWQHFAGTNHEECAAPMLAFKRPEVICNWLEGLCLDSIN